MFAAVTYLHFNIHYFISVISSLHFPGPICLGVSKRGRKQEDNCYSGKARRKRCLQISLNEKERNWPEGSPEHIFKSQQAFAKVCSYLISPIPVEIKYLYRKNSTLCFFFKKNVFRFDPKSPESVLIAQKIDALFESGQCSFCSTLNQ